MDSMPLPFGSVMAAGTEPTTPPPESLNLTAITANKKKEAILQCWQLDAPLIPSNSAGTSGAVFAQLGETGKTSYGIIPPKFDGGLHTAPAVQYVVFLSGKAVITLPNSTDSATIIGGRNGLIIAADTLKYSDYGHITNYPSKAETVAMQIPTEDDKIPPHKVLYNGACCAAELT
ncbi:MAG: hypothetical protein M1831_000112 [Alyxoria varia]|nr:MAG: hypothetical protein M1831_000112 [Alyxoria varia]